MPVTVALVDDEQRNFDPIDDLYKIRGNPECNYRLQPGFDSQMTWAFRVPAAVHVLGLGFRDTTDYSLQSDWTTVRLTVPGA